MTEFPFHLALNGQSAGPYTLAQVQEMWRAGQVSAQTLYWQEGQPNWQPLGQIAGTFGEAPTRPPGPPMLPVAGTSLPATQPTLASVPPTSGLAIASLVLGLLSLIVVVTCLPAVICGHLALSQIKQSAGRIGGRGVALAGMIIGYLFIGLFAGIFFVGILAGIALPVFNSVSERGKATVDLAHAKQIALAIRVYEGDHDGKTPPNFDALFPTYLSDRSVLMSGLQPDDSSPGYEYLTPDTDGEKLDPHTLMLRGRYATNNHRRVYIYADASGEVKRDP